MKLAFGRKNSFRAIAACLGVMGLMAAACAGSSYAYDEDADDDPQAIDLAQKLSQGRSKSPAFAVLKTREAMMPHPVLPSGNTFIKEVSISGAHLLADEAVAELKAAYQNRDLTARDMQKCVDRINRAYSREGYITSYAYIVPDRLPDGVLEIVVVEGKTGKIEIKGNKVFSTDLLRKKLSLKEGEPFNFKQLNLDVFRINKAPDRKISIVLAPDETTGSTDIILTVKERSPLHTTLQADNYGSQSILYNRYKTILTHNNISGHDDSLTAKVEWADADSHKIFDLDYSIPLNETWKFQLYVLPYKSEDYYYSDNELTDFEKRARKFYFWFYQSLINEPGIELVSSYGFTYFDIWWYKPYEEYKEPTKKDSFRVLKWDLALNRVDDHGRWVITNDLQKAIPDIFGGSPEKSDTTSVNGAKGDYVKDLITIARRQKLFHGLDFLSKARAQFSSATLTGVNAFSSGGYYGVIDNRGYPRTQAPGDSGYALSLGFDFPPYFIPRTMKAPFATTAKLYDSMKLFTFWDWSKAILKSPDPDEKKQTTLTSAGFGFLYMVPEQSFSVRLDVGFPLSAHVTPKDTDHTHAWWSVTKGF